MRIRALLILVAVLTAIPAATAGAAGSTSVYQVWLQRGSKLWLVKREQPVTTAPAHAAMQSLLTGPTVAEADAGVRSQVPRSTTLLGLSIASGTATVDLDDAFAAAGTRAAVRMRLAELTYTLTQFTTVDRVALRIDGRPVSSLAGVAVPRTMTRSDFQGLLPVITVWNPPIGSHVATSVRVSGDANVYEASIHVRIVDQRGLTVGHANTLASCGTGCRGGYTVLVPFSVDRDQLGTIIVSDDDTDGDGVPQHQVRVPVVLLKV
jgi:hypothetical protein